MITYYITNNRGRDVERLLAFEGQSQVVKFDLGSWEEVNGTVTSAVWSLKNGSASISGESLTGSIASATITTAQSGRSMIKIVLTSGSNVEILHLETMAKDPEVITEDYGFEYR